MHSQHELEPKPPSSPKTRVQNRTRPRSGGRRNDDIEARLASIEKLKSGLAIETNKTKKNNWTSGISSAVDCFPDGGGNKSSEEVLSSAFVCSGCDKEYISKRDLDIHKPFCFARLWFIWCMFLLVEIFAYSRFSKMSESNVFLTLVVLCFVNLILMIFFFSLAPNEY